MLASLIPIQNCPHSGVYQWHIRFRCQLTQYVIDNDNHLSYKSSHVYPQSEDGEIAAMATQTEAMMALMDVTYETR